MWCGKEKHMKQGLAAIILFMLISIACGFSASAAAPTSVPPTLASPTLVLPTSTVDTSVTLTFENNSGVPVDYYWVNLSGEEEKYGTINSGRSVELSTNFEHVWRIRDQTGNLVMEYSVTKDARQIVTIAAEAIVAADPVAADLSAQVQTFKDEGRIPTIDGEYIKLEDFNQTFSQLGFYQPYPTGINLENFVFSGHFKWSTAMATSDVSACGIVFAGQTDNSGYAVFLDKSRVYFSSSTATTYSELGKTSGTGRVSFGNPAEADFSLVVYRTHAYVYVDGQFIGEYTLSSSKPLKGTFGYGIISGTNKDYGTSCEITNAGIWSLK
jgi:hypothetical protein